MVKEGSFTLSLSPPTPNSAQVSVDKDPNSARFQSQQREPGMNPTSLALRVVPKGTAPVSPHPEVLRDPA